MAEIDRIKAIKQKVKHGKIRIERKDVKAQLTKDLHKTDKEREEICKKARKDAHKPIANMRRKMSNEIRSGLNNILSEGYDFIEESCGSGMPEFTFYDEPQISESISESFSKDNKYKMIGVAEGVFAPIGVMSRNNRIYDDDHYDYLLENQILVDKINNRGMLGTIGHHDKRVDDEDLAEGKVSHIVTDLHIQEEADGTRNLVGRLEILDTPAGNLLKTYYDSGMPLYVSSRGAGKLLPVANESYKRVDKTNYYLETFDIVRDPGFLGAKPKYVTESLDENNIDGDNDMGKEKVTPAISTDMETEAIVNKMLHPLQEQLAELTEAVKMLTDRVLDDKSEEVSEECDACAEPKEETEDDQHEEKAPVAPEVVEGTKEEAVVEEKENDDAENAKEDEAEAKKLEADAEEDKEDAEEIKESTEVVSEECDKEDKEEKKEDEEKVEEVVSEECDKEEKKEEKKEDEKEEKAEKVSEEVVEADDDEVTEDDEEEVTEEKKAEEAEKLEADAEEDEAKAEKLEKDAKEDKEDEKVDEAVSEECDKEEKEEKKEEAEEVAESSNEETMKELLKIVEDATIRTKEVLGKYNSAIAELNAYKLSEEFSITVDEAKERLASSTVEAIREELAKAEETPVEVEKEDDAKEESAPAVTESKKHVKGVFSRFSSLSESNSRKGVFSVFKNL